MVTIPKPNPRIAGPLWSLWLGIALATLLVMVVVGLLAGLTFRAMAVIFGLGVVAWLAASLWLLASDRRTQARERQAYERVLEEADTVRLSNE
ncbi:hypothetical protein [Stomatohabitans albus]|uniref:hypothetical protein n=1 Tax=Stomatohabitans albus TaxID=3110766 RepID=UPI00300DA2B8